MSSNSDHLCRRSSIHLASIRVLVNNLMSPLGSRTALRTLAGSEAPLGLMSNVVRAKFTQSVISDVDLSSKAFFSGLMLCMITCEGLNLLISLFDGGDVGAVILCMEAVGGKALLVFFRATCAQVIGFLGSSWVGRVGLNASTLRVSSSSRSSWLAMPSSLVWTFRKSPIMMWRRPKVSADIRTLPSGFQARAMDSQS